MSEHHTFQSNATNAWIFNGTNGNLNNNNARINTNAARVLRDSYHEEMVAGDDLPMKLPQLYEWYFIARKGKRKSPSQAEFELYYPQLLREIFHDLVFQEYIPWPGILFMLRYPTLRECSAPVFRDRPVETLFCESIRQGVDRRMDPDSYACRPGGGALKAVDKLIWYWRIESDNGRIPCVWVSLDQKSFFFHLYKPLVRETFDEIIRETFPEGPMRNMMLYISRIIIEGTPIEHAVRQCGIHEWDGLPPHKQQKNLPPYQGMSIGRLPVQLAGGLVSAMSYLAILREFGYGRFVHYTDDVKMPLRADRLDGFLRHFMPELRKREAQYHLELNEKKTAVQPDRHGVQAFGYFIKPLPGGRVLVYPSRRIVHNIERCIEYYMQQADDRLYRLRHKEQLVNRINSYYGQLRHCDAYNLRTAYAQQILASPWADVIEVKGDNEYFAVRKPYTRRAYYTWKNRQLKRYVNEKRNDQAA